MSPPKWPLFLVSFFCSLALVQSWTFAADDLQPEISRAAQKIAAVMRSQGKESISVLGFEDKTTFGATVLPGLEQILIDELKKAGATIKAKGAAVGVKGKLKIPQEDAGGEFPGPRFFRVEFQLTDSFGEDLVALNVKIPLPPTLVRPEFIDDDPAANRFDVQQGKINEDFYASDAALIAFGGNVDLNDAGVDPIEALQENTEKPTAVIAQDGVSAKASANSPFAVRVVSNGKSKPLRVVDGAPFVDLEPGEKFTLQIENSAAYVVDTTTTLDGLNSFRFARQRNKDGTPAHTSLLVNPGTGQIRGWFLDNATAQEFVATSFEQSKLHELGLSQTPVGAITVVFRATWKLGERSPDSENSFKQKVILADGTVSYEYVQQAKSTFIGGGDEVADNIGQVEKPIIGRVRGVVTIRYRHPLVK